MDGVVCWRLWKSRNELIFGNSSSSIDELVASTVEWAPSMANMSLHEQLSKVTRVVIKAGARRMWAGLRSTQTGRSRIATKRTDKRVIRFTGWYYNNNYYLITLTSQVFSVVGGGTTYKFLFIFLSSQNTFLILLNII